MKESLKQPALYVPDDSITIWRISYNLDGPPDRWYYPRVPDTTLLGEDTETPRICFCKELAYCLEAIPCAGYHDDNEIVLAFPLHISSQDPDFIPTEKLLDKVPDAVLTGECWYMRPVHLNGIQMKVSDIIRTAPPSDNWWD